MKTKNTQLKPGGPHTTVTSASLLIRLTAYRAAVLALLFVGATVLGTSAASADTITVININDSGPGSLRQALVDANDGDTIDFDSSLKGQTIILTSGQLNVDKDVTISGPGPNNLAVDGNAQSRVFYVMRDQGENVTIDGLTIENGSDLFGGGIYNDRTSTLTLSNCTISGNSGGGISSSGFNGDATLTVTDSTISGNSAGAGGGISSGAGGTDGGSSVVTVNNSTISGNSAGDGGGIASGAGRNGSVVLYIADSTLSGNSATGNGGGIYNAGRFPYLELGSTVLNAGSSGENIFNDGGTVTSLGYNVSSDNGGGYLTGPGDQINTDPLLGPLQDNGGPTFTHALLLSSPAIDTGDPSFTPPPFYDQRGPGFDRVVNSRIDVGSFEVQARPRVTPTPRSHPTPAPRP